jgi:hypothetical protein
LTAGNLTTDQVPSGQVPSGQVPSGHVGERSSGWFPAGRANLIGCPAVMLVLLAAAHEVGYFQKQILLTLNFEI